nr:hypothetical protein [uncultured Desulfobulbus sp.]
MLHQARAVGVHDFVLPGVDRDGGEQLMRVSGSEPGVHAEPGLHPMYPHRKRFAHGGIVHAFSASQQQPLAYVTLGFDIGKGGVITYDRMRKDVTCPNTYRYSCAPDRIAKRSPGNNSCLYPPKRPPYLEPGARAIRFLKRKNPEGLVSIQGSLHDQTRGVGYVGAKGR